ncbi:MFS transporter [Microvirga soli]|uniref:MFS transporter n=1 Tax=Microvirga soli TaxID=1854496 RepID=UPI00191D22E5|nr:MFS transporter [Microvirga soli]
MSPDLLSRRTITFVNIAHALDHFVLLIYPTAVIAIAAERQLSYDSLISLSTGAFVAFGLFSLPMGWIADRVGRRNLLGIFFGGCGIACLGLSTANSSVMFGIWLFVLGLFSAIYHPIGSTALVTHTSHLGRDLGINGVWGNLGAAFASGITALLAASLGWRAAFIFPGLTCLLAGIAFIILVPGDGDPHGKSGSARAEIPVTRPMTLFLLFAAAIVAGGMTFNITTIALPKIIDERAGTTLPLVVIGSLATLVFVFGALTQLLMGRLVDRYTLPRIFVGLTILQPLGLGLAALTSGIPMLAGLVLAMAAIYGQVVVNDAMVARYVPAQYRARAFSVRYFLGFTTSGLAVPLIALLHGMSGFTLVLSMAATFGTVIFLCSLGFFLAVQSPSEPSSLPAR